MRIFLLLYKGVATDCTAHIAIQDTVSATILQNYQDPVLSAGVDDWAFQGVDMAFFDSII